MTKIHGKQNFCNFQATQAAAELRLLEAWGERISGFGISGISKCNLLIKCFQNSLINSINQVISGSKML